MENLKSTQSFEMMISLEYYRINILASRYPLTSDEYSSFIDIQGKFYFRFLMINLSKRDYIEDVLEEIAHSRKFSKDFKNTLYREFKISKK